MRLTLDQLSDLHHEVEQQGGARLPQECLGTLVHYRKPKSVKIRTCSCGNETLFVLPYEVLRVAKRKGAEDRGGGFVTMCAVCDSMPLMPRFDHILRDSGELDIEVEFDEDAP